MQWFFVQKPTAAAYRRLHASAAGCLSAAEGHRPLGQPEAETAEKSTAAVALFLPHGDDVDGEYVRLLVSGLVEEPGEKPGDEPGFLLLFLSMVQIGGQKHRRTEPNSWPALLACKQGGGSAPMRWVNFRLPHPERLSSPTSFSSTTSSSSSPVSAKSMRFIWNNIFSKGSHMLQCLCGRSLKKNKNPTANQLLQQTQQPYRYLIETVRKRDTEISALKERITSLEDDVSSLRKERTALQQVKNNMAADLERLLNHREELAVMKQVLISMRSRQGDALNLLETDKTGIRTSGARKHQSRHINRTTEEESPNKPKPTVFTNKEAPDWYQMLKQKPK